MTVHVREFVQYIVGVFSVFCLQLYRVCGVAHM